MKRNAIISLLLVLLVFFVVTCKREYSYEGGTTAAFSFVGRPDTCVGVIVYGDYYLSQSLAFNSVSLSVLVTTIGNYNISTDNVNGFAFSGSGKFTDTGFQEVRLLANGTPLDTGYFSFKIPGTEGCSFTVHVSGKPDANYQIADQPSDCTPPVLQGTYQKDVAVTNTNTATVDVNVITTGHYYLTTSRVNGLSFSAEGDFTTTGAQKIILQAEGTPQIPGLYYMAYGKAGTVCGFNVPVTSAAPFAEYVLQSASGSDITTCAPGSVQGVYTKGQTLAAANSLTVNAYVIQPGNYTLSTQLENGMQFSANGTFTQPGSVDVILRGTGIPDAAGTYNFYPQIIGPAPRGGSVCGLSVVVQP